MPYGDYYLADTGTAVFESALFYGWMAFLAFALVSLIVKGIRAIVRKVKKSDKKIMLGKTTGFIALVELLLGLCGLGIILSISVWLPHTVYMWFFYAVGALTLVLAALTIYAVIKFIRTPRKESSVIRKIYNIIAIAGAVLTVVFVVYMQLWHW